MHNKDKLTFDTYCILNIAWINLSHLSWPRIISPMCFLTWREHFHLVNIFSGWNICYWFLDIFTGVFFFYSYQQYEESSNVHYGSILCTELWKTMWVTTAVQYIVCKWLLLFLLNKKRSLLALSLCCLHPFWLIISNDIETVLPLWCQLFGGNIKDWLKFLLLKLFCDLDIDL